MAQGMDSYLKGDSLHSNDVYMQFFKCMTLEIEHGSDGVSEHLDLIPAERCPAASQEEIEIATKIRQAELKMERTSNS